MRFKVDENLPIDIAGILRARGFDAMTVGEEALIGAPDPAISAAAQVEGRVLLALDRDFADIRRYPPEDCPGRIVLRLKNQAKGHVADVVMHVLKVLEGNSIEGQLWIVEETRIRMRGSGS